MRYDSDQRDDAELALFARRNVPPAVAVGRNPLMPPIEDNDGDVKHQNKMLSIEEWSGKFARSWRMIPTFLVESNCTRQSRD